MKSKRYPELHTRPRTPYWVFRKYSSQKGREFVRSTGVLATEGNAALAYKKGLAEFNDWLGSRIDTSRPVLIRDIARSCKVAKESKRPATYEAFKGIIDNYITPEFGHLRPDQVTSLVWERYVTEETARGKRKTFFNIRKALKEILGRAHESKLIDRIPKLKLNDPEPDKPQYIDLKTYREIRRAISWPMKLLPFLMYYQGPRPGEAIRYTWEMIHLDEGPTGAIHIPGEIVKTGRSRVIPLNSRVSRALRWLHGRTSSGFLFPSRRGGDKSAVAWLTVWNRARDQLGLDYTIYNLRDTFITNRLKAGISESFVGRYCDTSPEQIHRRYAVAEKEIMQRVAG